MNREEVDEAVAKIKAALREQWVLIAAGAWQRCSRGKCSRGFDLVFEKRGTGELRKERHECKPEHVELWRTLKGLFWRLPVVLPTGMQEQSGTTADG